MKLVVPHLEFSFKLKKHSKSRYKHEVRRLKRKQNRLLQDKLAGLSAQKNLKDFWSQIKKLNRSRSSSTSPVVDGLCDSKSIVQIDLPQHFLVF